MTMTYKSNLASVMKHFNSKFDEMKYAIGSIISSEISEKAQKNIYQHSVPLLKRSKKPKYKRTHQLSQAMGFNVKKNAVSIFTNRKYAKRLEQLVGPRWKTHWFNLDLKKAIKDMRANFGTPYSSFVTGFISGMKKAKKFLSEQGFGIKWKI